MCALDSSCRRDHQEQSTYRGGPSHQSPAASTERPRPQPATLNSRQQLTFRPFLIPFFCPRFRSTSCPSIKSFHLSFSLIEKKKKHFVLIYNTKSCINKEREFVILYEHWGICLCNTIVQSQEGETLESERGQREGPIEMWRESFPLVQTWIGCVDCHRQTHTHTEER